jgi:hypothetical protein
MMGKKITPSRHWTKEEVRMLKSLAHEKTKTMVIARGRGVPAASKLVRVSFRQQANTIGIVVVAALAANAATPVDGLPAAATSVGCF